MGIRIYSFAQAAAITKISQQTLRKYVKRGWVTPQYPQALPGGRHGFGDENLALIIEITDLQPGEKTAARKAARADPVTLREQEGAKERNRRIETTLKTLQALAKKSRMTKKALDDPR